MMPDPTASLTCPFCGLLCDDLPAAGTPFPAVDCARARRLFAGPAAAPARIGGQPADAGGAVAAAAGLLARARRPLIGGLACDVAGQRAALDLAEQAGGVLEHMNGNAQFRNWLAFQDGGWMTTTLSEVRNRADLVVFAGTDATRFPRFHARCLAPVSQFGELRRRTLSLGPVPPAGRLQDAGEDLAAPVPADRLAELCAGLLARLAGRRPAAAEVAGVPVAQLDAWLDLMRAARYGVLVWNAAELDFPHADLTVRALADLVRALNRSGRWSGLPLGGNDGDTSAAQACTWRTGYPGRVAFEADGPRYEPVLYAADRLLARREVDALVWIAALDPERGPPAADCPVIVVGRPDLRLDQPVEMFIPVAVPGVQRAGVLHRMDGIVALPLAAPLAAELPSVAEVLAAITEAMRHAAAG